MLADKLESYDKTGKFVSVTPAKYKKDHPYLKEVDSLALANTQLNLQRAFRNCFSKSRKREMVSLNSNLPSTAGSHTQQTISMVRLPYMKKL